MARTTRNPATATRNADKAGAAAHKAKAAAAAAAAALAETDETDEAADEAAPALRGWSAERARHAAGKAGAAGRCYRLAFVLATEAKPGATVSVGFGKANELCNLRRGERGDPVASWALAVSRMYSLFGRDADGTVSGFGFAARVNAETSKIDVSAPA